MTGDLRVKEVAKQGCGYAARNVAPQEFCPHNFSFAALRKNGMGVSAPTSKNSNDCGVFASLKRFATRVLVVEVFKLLIEVGIDLLQFFWPFEEALGGDGEEFSGVFSGIGA